jgi:two-component system sensor histidine kinase MprB
VSLRLRVALFTALAVALVEVAIVASVYAFVSYRLYAQIEEDLRDIASVVVPVVRTTGDLPVRPSQDVERPPFVPRLVDADGRVVSARGSLDIPVTPAARAVAAGEETSALETLRAGGASFYVLTVPLGDGRTVQIARSLADVEDVLRQLLAAAAAFAAAGLVVAPFAGAAVATGALVPLRRLARVAERVRETGTLDARVGARGSDELASFARSFDAMLDRLEATVDEVERARAAQRQLVADASHELRAPLAALRANVELLSLGSDAPIEDPDALLADTRAGIEELGVLVGQLIDLAREDQRVHDRAEVRVDRLVLDEVDRVQRRYPSVQIATDVEPTIVVGDAEALARAVANLVDNAAKWTPAGRRVDVRLARAVLEVADQGPGIDEADMPRIFERFYRGRRAAGVPGSGLGLAIVAQVMAAHGGSVAARSAPGGGAVFTARFEPEAS